MKKNLTLLLFVLITIVSFGQINYKDVVYLKNGSIIRGIITEQVPNKLIKIETEDRNVFVYSIDEVEKLTKEQPQGNCLQPGYKGIAELGFQVGTGTFGMDRLKFNVINSYQVNPYFSLGIGTGLRYYFDADAALIPIFADIRTNIINNNISPYFSLGVGYTFDATNNLEKVGFLLNPTIGVSVMISDKSAIHIGVGYEMQKINVYYDLQYLSYSKSENFGAICINLGISFQ